MNLEQLTAQYSKQYNVIHILNLDLWYKQPLLEREEWLESQITPLYKPAYDGNDRILFILSEPDEYTDVSNAAGVILTTLQHCLNRVDVSNFFVVLLTTNPLLMDPAVAWVSRQSTDTVPITVDYFDSNATGVKRSADAAVSTGYNYNSVQPLKIKIADLSAHEQELLLTSKNFCIYPWLHLYVDPSGKTYTCCGSLYNDDAVLGNTNQHTLKHIWNNDKTRQVRLNMLADKPIDSCSRCYEQEKSGFFSMRNAANKHHGHHISRVHNTQESGAVEDFSMVYWDVRFNNLCNLKCRSCGPSFSSSWYQDQIQLAPDYSKNHKALIFAGKFETDLWDQLIDHIDHVEQIYFAGGEPIMMDEHYRILEELDRRSKYDVRLIYNTNFTQTQLKDRSVFDYWKKFDNVSVGASLDAQYARGEYIRKGTDWAQVIENRKKMMEICPRVDFYISATLSIMNALHLPDFHQEWVEQGLIKPQDFNINLLTDPLHYRIDVVPAEYKAKIERRYREHIEWLSPLDHLRRATTGFESAITFMNATDNTHLIDTFWRKTHELDAIRNEKWDWYLPELKALK